MSDEGNDYENNKMNTVERVGHDTSFKVGYSYSNYKQTSKELGHSDNRVSDQT